MIAPSSPLSNGTTRTHSHWLIFRRLWLTLKKQKSHKQCERCINRTHIHNRVRVRDRCNCRFLLHARAQYKIYSMKSSTNIRTARRRSLILNQPQSTKSWRRIVGSGDAHFFIIQRRARRAGWSRSTHHH